MKVEKITIKKELLEIPEYSNHRIYYSLTNKENLELSHNIETVNIVKEEFVVREILNNFKETKIYLVRIDDLNVFNDLIEITKDELKKLKNNWQEEFMAYEEPIIRNDVRAGIRNMGFLRKIKFLFFGKF